MTGNGKQAQPIQKTLQKSEAAAAERTKEAHFIYRACLESLLYNSFASVQAQVFAIGSSFFVCSLQVILPIEVKAENKGMVVYSWVLRNA